MIIQYAWMTASKCDIHYGLEHWTRKQTKWRGLFLFGFIPLYIWVIDYQYKEYRG